MGNMFNKSDNLPPYNGDDMAGYIMATGFKLPDHEPQSIKSITNVRNTAIIVTDYNIYRAKPCYKIGFCIELLAVI